MKKSIIMLAGAMVALTSCDDNSWNDKLDGFDGEPAITDVQNINYTLTKNDYSTIAGLSANEALAGTANAAALAAVKKNCYFTDVITAQEYVPAFLASSSFQYFVLDNGSTVKVTYDYFEGLTEEIQTLQSAENYEVSAADYQTAWGSDVDYIKAYSPAVAPASNIPAALTAAGLGTEKGQYAVVSYNYTEEEPSFDIPPYYYVPTTEAPAEATQVLLAAEGNVAYTVAEGKSYGYFYPTTVTVEEQGIISSSIEDTNVFTLTPTEGGYYLQDCYGRYVYMSGTYNSFNFSADLVDGAVWELTFVDGLAKLLNTSVSKWIQYSTDYSSYGCYNYDNGLLPTLYTPDPEANTEKVEPETTLTYALYYYTGSRWTASSDAAVVQPTDYAAMDESGNYMTNADASKYLPLYLKQKYPYAVKNDQKYVVYFTSSKGDIAASQYTFDGSAWTLNNGVVTRTTKFTKENGVWTVGAGLASFTHTIATELVSGEKYLIVTGTVAATAVSTSKTYGYLNGTTVESDETNVNLPDAEECEFTLTDEGDGWSIMDCYGRYYYLSGTYNSFNVATEVDFSSTSDCPLWTIEFLEDGTAQITNTSKQKTVQYDSSYSSYGAYSSITHDLPCLYKAVGQ